VAARLRAAVSRLARRLKPTAAAGALTVTEVDVLVTTSHRGPLRLSDLAQVAGLNPTMLSRVVAKLEEQGLLRRLADESDGRVCRVEVTTQGRRLHERIRTERTDVLSHQLDRLEPHQRRAVEAALPVLEALAERLLEPGGGGAA
jgi:DNA-binding MarR family transcriptional regulator